MLLWIYILTACLGTALGLGQKKTLAFSPSPGSLPLVANGTVASLVLSGQDWPGVIRAAQDLANDFGRITSHNLTLRTTNSTSLSSGLSIAKGGTVVLAGTLGRSPLVDGLVSSGALNVSAIRGEWEAFHTQLLTLNGTRALIIAGADKRGTIFGLYDLSEQLGVSPWLWFADVAPAVHHTAVYALPVVRTQGAPSVQYRGIFINDEAPALTNWVNAKYPPARYGPAYVHQFYERLFELLLRMRANFLWPAGSDWDSMFGPDDPLNQPLADEWGIVMATSHTEPLMRATKEWTVFGHGAWDYTTNKDNITKFWQDGIQRSKPYDNMWTMGMRGLGDNPLSTTIATTLLEGIIQDQRKLLADGFGISEANVGQVPQVWCLYKDVQSYYEAGMTVPDDITLLWTDDNYGNVRRLPMANETARISGAGMYYHFDYVGDPRDYKWINTIQPQKTWEQMHLTYERNANKIWVVNMGDIKGLEQPMDYFLTLAYDFDTWGPLGRIGAYQLAWATREFGPTHAAEIAEIVNKYGLYSSRRKYELVDPETYNVVNYDEAKTVLAQWANLSARAQAVYDALPAVSKPSFFEMVLHPTKAGYVVHDIHISAGFNRLYAHQRRNSANPLASHVLDRFDDDNTLKEEYHTLLDGKWDHIMDQPHLGYSYWQQPMRDTLPPLWWTQTKVSSVAGTIGVGVDGGNGTVPGDDEFNVALSNNTLVLPPIDPFLPESRGRWIEIFARGVNPFSFTVTPSASWVKATPSTGHIDPTDPSTDMRVWLSVDWDAAPAGNNIVFISIKSSTGDYGNTAAPSVNLPVHKTSVPAGFHGHVESDGHVSIEAAHSPTLPPSNTTSSSNTSSPHYVEIPGLGRTLSAVTLFPARAPSQSPTNAASPRLDYPLYLFTNSTASVTVLLGAAWNIDPERPLKYAIAFDGEAPQTVRYVPPLTDPLGEPPGWAPAVAAGNTWSSTTKHTIKVAGARTLTVWLLEPAVVLQKVVVDLGGVRQSYLGPPESTIV